MDVKVFKRFLSLLRNRKKSFRVLGIETSCDDTCAAVVDSDKNILGDSRFKQTSIHVHLGGILPPLAESLHLAKIKDVTDEAIKKSQLTIKDLDAIAVSIEPGQIKSLIVGCEYAKDLCSLYEKPLIPIHHMQAHALTSRLVEDVDFPFLVLLISGRHSILAVAEGVTRFLVLGTDKMGPGSALDKITRRLKVKNLKGFECIQGGVAIEMLASTGNPFAICFPKPKNIGKNCNFYFTDLKSQFSSYITRKETELRLAPDAPLPNIHDVCASFQYAIMKHICSRVEVAMEYVKHKGLISDRQKTLVVSGGVACNRLLRKLLSHVCDEHNYKLSIPPPDLCVDNGVMVAWNGIEMLKANQPLVESKDFYEVYCRPECPLGESLTDVHVKKGKFVNLDQFLTDDALKKPDPEKNSVHN